MEQLSHDIEGYVVCPSCSTLVLEVVARRCRGVCDRCLLAGWSKRFREVEIVNRGTRSTVRFERKPSKGRGLRSTNRAVEKAKIRAMKRLRALFPDLYDVLLAEERARAGLEPFPLESSVAPIDVETAERTFEFAAVYAALAEQGVDLDGAEEAQGGEAGRARG